MPTSSIFVSLFFPIFFTTIFYSDFHSQGQIVNRGILGRNSYSIHVEIKVPMKRKLSLSYLNELLKLLGMLTSLISHVVLEIFRYTPVVKQE